MHEGDEQGSKYPSKGEYRLAGKYVWLQTGRETGKGSRGTMETRGMSLLHVNSLPPTPGLQASTRTAQYRIERGSYNESND